MTMDLNELMEIAGIVVALDDTSIKVKRIADENVKLKAELAYFQSYMLSNDGKICTCCERVRHVDDMVRGTDREGDDTAWFCSKDCRDKARRMHEEHCDHGQEVEDYLNCKAWR